MENSNYFKAASFSARQEIPFMLRRVVTGIVYDPLVRGVSEVAP
jgi:hypothetical protein